MGTCTLRHFSVLRKSSQAPGQLDRALGSDGPLCPRCDGLGCWHLRLRACSFSRCTGPPDSDSPLYLPYKSLVSTVGSMVFNEGEAQRLIEILSEKAGVIQDTWHKVGSPSPSHI